MIDTRHNRKETAETPALGLRFSDILYVLFRQKWIILACFALGLIAGVIVFLAQKTLYWSEAKLLVRYVTETKSVEAAVGSQIKSPDYAGEMIINSELEILSSLDLCEEVAKIVGPDKILAKLGGGSNVTAAALAVANNLKSQNPPRSNIIKVRFSHPDPAMCQVVLQQVITSYFQRHKDFHRTGRNYEALLSEEAQAIVARIRQYEEELQRLNKRAGVVSVEETKKNLAGELARLRQKLFDTEADIANMRAILGSTPAPAKETNSLEANLPPVKVSEYKLTCARLDSMRNREFELTTTHSYTDENPLVMNVRQQISEQEKKKADMEKEFPGLAGLYVSPSPSTARTPEMRLDPRQLLALEATLAVITNQIAQVRADLETIDGLENSIADVQRRKQIEEQEYQHVMAGLRAASFDEKMSAAKISNIQPVQTPSPPAPNVSQRLKLVGSTFAGFLALGIAIAFLIEFFVDHTVRKPREFEAKLKLPLFLSIPKLGLNGHSKLLPFPAPSADAGNEESADDLGETWAMDHPLRRYIDGLRDATLTHFGGDPHKPKLIGITSCGSNSGVTSIAAGLAGALSETGDGNVLLLNLNYEDEAAHPFYRGELACCLTDALELDKRVNGKVLQNLYVATAGNPGDPTTQSLPKQLARVVPKLRVCDYDYIVFDLPPTAPTTMTARLAGMMDLVILVVESEKDTQDSVKEAARLLARSKAPVSAVLNKVRDPVPKWLQQGA